MSKPLEGLLVIALEQAVAAPYCSSRLADAGARVIKIERPEGDFARGYDQAARGQASYFVWLNRGKQSLVLDIKKPEDAALLQRLLAKADVFIQNLLPGAAERAGVGSAALRRRHRRLITCDISGYGDDGPYAAMRAYDMLVQCETGLASVTGGPDAPGRVGVSVCDIAAGMYAHQAILEALIKRGRTGEGAGIAVSLFDGMADWMAVPLMQHDGGKAPTRVGLMHPTVAPYEAFPAKDGIPIVISIQNEREWARFCADILGDADLATHPDYGSNVQRVKNRPAMHALIAATFSKLDSEVLAERLLKAGVAFGRLNGIAEFARHPQLRRAVVATPNGDVTVPAPPPRIAGESVALGRVPAIGEHNDRIRREFA
jgi:crotonobetainyl-CoA:carnitine CoA-transferase CaiB-like acyl-CoA transferase